MIALEHRRVLPERDHEAEQALIGRFADFWNSADQANLRGSYDTFIGMTPIAADAAFEEVVASDIRGCWCQPAGASPDRAILYLHGGAYVMGSAAAYRGFASQIARRTGVATFVLDYPLAPEHPFPAALENAGQARRWLGELGYRRIAVAGDSAGGGLSFATLGNGSISGSPQVVACVAFSPWVDLALTGESASSPEGFDPLLSREQLVESARQYAGDTDVRDPRVSPLYSNPHDLPPVFIQVGTRELLLDDARRYTKMIASTGGLVRLDVWEDLHHVFQLNVEELESGRHALDEAAQFLTSCFDNDPIATRSAR